MSAADALRRAIRDAIANARCAHSQPACADCAAAAVVLRATGARTGARDLDVSSFGDADEQLIRDWYVTADFTIEQKPYTRPRPPLEFLT